MVCRTLTLSWTKEGDRRLPVTPGQQSKQLSIWRGRSLQQPDMHRQRYCVPGLRPPRPCSPAHMCRLSGSSGLGGCSSCSGETARSHPWVGICAKPLNQQCGRLPLCRLLQHHCNTGTHTHAHPPHLHPTQLIHRPFIYSLTINHSIHSPLKASFFVLSLWISRGESIQSSEVKRWDVKVAENDTEHLSIYRDK